MAQTSYYEIVGVPETANADEIRKAYRRKAFEWHPDKVVQLDAAAQDLARRNMAFLNEAYEVLSDAAKRREYDEFLQVVRTKRAAAKPAGGAAAGHPAPGHAPQAAPHPAPHAAPAHAPSPVRPAPEPAPPPPNSRTASVPPPRPPKPRVTPPPEPDPQELTKRLERLLSQLSQEVTGSAGDCKWKPVQAAGFDLGLEGTKGGERYGVYAATADQLSIAGLDEFRAKLAAAVPATQFSLLKRFTVLLVLCLGLDDERKVRAHVRELNQAALATLAKKRGETLLVGYLHAQTGELWAPYLRTIRPDLRNLRSVATAD